MMPEGIYKATNQRVIVSIRDHALFAKYLANDPQGAIEYVNVKLDTASRLEERRQNILAVFSE